MRATMRITWLLLSLSEYTFISLINRIYLLVSGLVVMVDAFVCYSFLYDTVL